MTTKKHPTEEAPAHDAPISAATAVKLCAHLLLTESEALAILGAPAVTPEEVHDAAKVDLHAVAHAFGAATVHTLTTDPKVELPADAGTPVSARADRVRVASSACDKLEAVLDATTASVRVDAGVLQDLANTVVPQIRARARANAAVRTTYSSLLAYQHARYPGRGHGAHVAAPPTSATNVGAPASAAK